MASIALAAPALAQTAAPATAPRDQNQNPPPGGGDGTAAPSSVDDMEAAVLGAPPPPADANTAGAPPAGMRGAVPPPPPRRRRVISDGQPEASAAAEAGDETAFVIELSTGSFASGTLQGGLFLGGRLSSGLIIGGNVDYASQSQSLTQGTMSATTSASVFRLGAGASYPIIRTADRRVDLYGAASAGLEAVSAEAPPAAGAAPGSANATALGFTLAVGPGLRLWVHDHVAIGYLARLRWTHLSGDAGAIDSATTAASNSNASSTTIGFEGVFQVLGVF